METKMMETQGLVQILVAMGLRTGLHMGELQAAIGEEWLRQRRMARTPEQRAAAAAKAKATRAERKAAWAPLLRGPAGYDTFEAEHAANRAKLREALGEEGWTKYLHEKEVAEFGGHHYGHREILRYAVGARAARKAIKAAGLEDAFF